MGSYHDTRDNRDSRPFNRFRSSDRINEDDVPESKHTIFIRGLPGSMSTDEIKDFFEDKIGPVTFDFVKTSPDNVRLFVAVRFETREDAKKAMTQFADRDLLGHRCDLSWFKDIRRFAEYQKAQGIMSSRGRGGFRGRGSYRGGYRGDYRDRRRSRERSRSRSSKRSSRSRSQSRSDSDRSRRSRSRSERRSSSRGNNRSSSRESGRSRDSDYRRKDRRKRRSHRSVSNHSKISSDGEPNKDDSRSPSPMPAPPVNNPPPPTIKVSIKTTKEDLPEIPVPVPPPASEVPVPKLVSPAPVPPPSAPSVDQLKTSFSIGMDTDEPKIIQKTENKEPILLGQERQYVANHPPVPSQQYMQQPDPRFRQHSERTDEPQHKIPRMETGRDEGIPFPPASNSQYQMNTNPYNSWTPVDKNKKNDVMQKHDNGFGYKVSSIDGTKFPIQSELFSNVRQYQEEMIKSVKAVPKEETFGSFSLSTLSADVDDNEMEKKCNREQRLSRMSEIEMERFQIHKRKLENAFKSDCSTFTAVTKKLLMKDPNLEKQLRMCLIETMEDLEKQMFEKIDESLGI